MSRACFLIGNVCISRVSRACSNIIDVNDALCNITKKHFHVNSYPLYSKHWNPKFRKERGLKMLKLELPDYDELRREKELTPEEIRAKMKERGIAPPRPWNEKPIFISCTGELADPYIPPEGDGKVSIVSKEGAKQKMEQLTKKGKSLLELRKLRKFEYDFDIPQFADKAQEIYVEAHKALAEKDEDKLHELVTEKCYPEMMHHAENKTIRWKLVQSLEPPRVVHIRCMDLITKENMFAQLTVRFHTQQTLAVYDRFGRLLYGSEHLLKDVLEYVVYEKHLSNQYGLWRIHGKIIPNWLPPKEPALRTIRKPNKQKPNVSKKIITPNPTETVSEPASL
ncbi:probable 39S ribosomal protein L45, mitochondrial isoform X1 [Centruroides sculpturatus]|uniref:probable 39S ribosomal protein L45, mitochondrial isoform X1 n=1 Tax=Centruroides sculpturatus TaxID=218467 RepID=UPI000C6CF387|nr:probable 39S ribosomal protein L45, mitochondrial isoform X1 [Centruroides sculpturatus]